MRLPAIHISQGKYVSTSCCYWRKIPGGEYLWTLLHIRKAVILLPLPCQISSLYWGDGSEERESSSSSSRYLVLNDYCYWIMLVILTNIPWHCIVFVKNIKQIATAAASDYNRIQLHHTPQRNIGCRPLYLARDLRPGKITLSSLKEIPDVVYRKSNCLWG